MTPEEIDEMSWPVVFVDERENVDLVTQFEIALYLSDKPELNGFYHGLDFLNHTKSLNFQTQNNLAEYFGYAQNTYYKFRHQLEEIGFIRIAKLGRKQIITFTGVTRQNWKIPQNPLEHLTFFKNLINQIKFVPQQRSVQLPMLPTEKPLPPKPKKEIKKEHKEDVIKFPNEMYALVLDAFNKAKGIELAGPEIARAKHAIKQMFLANRKPEQIVACIEFFASKQNHEQYQWLRHWTLETVMKKMPEFVAGKLKLFQIGDDLREL